MERPLVEIPGYYYDIEKRKYFKILPGSAAPPSSAYSSSDVKRRKIRDQAAEAREALSQRQRGYVKRSKVLERPLTGGILERSHGRQSRIEDSAIYADGLVEQGTLSPLAQFSVCHDPLFDIEHRMDLEDGVVDVRMVFDDQIWIARANVDKYKDSDAHGAVQINKNHGSSQMNRASWRLERFGHPGAATSLSTHQASRTAAFTWLSGVNHSGIAIIPMSGIPSDTEPERPTILLAAGGQHEVNVWSSTTAPDSSDDLFAFGTSDGIFAVDKERCDPRTICPTLSDWKNSPKEVFALEYLENDPSVLLSGTRSGVLNIIDTRLPFAGADVIVHSSSITHIKQIDAHRILVAGLSSTLCQYDLRYRKIDTPPALDHPQQHSKKARKAHHNSHHKPRRRATRAILSYPEYKNEATIRTGLDVDVESGLIAAGQEADDETSKVEIFSLHGGQKLKTLVAERCKSGGENDWSVRPSNCVKWVNDGYGKGKSLWAGVDKEVKRFTWATWAQGEVDYDC